MTTIRNYIDPDGLAIAIRQAGGWAYVERENKHDIVITRWSMRRVRQLAKDINWVRP